MLTQVLCRYSKHFETLITGLAMEIAKIYLLQDDNETPVSVNLVKRKIGSINTSAGLV